MQEKKKPTTTNNPFDAMSAENPFDKIDVRLSPIEERKRIAIEAILQRQAELFETSDDANMEGFMLRQKPEVVSTDEQKWLRENITPEDVQSLSLQEHAMLAQEIGLEGWELIYPTDARLGASYYQEGLFTPSDIPIDEREWLRHRLLNADYNKSGQQLVADMISFFKPWGRRDQSEGGDPDSTILPNIQNFLAAINELGIKIAGDIPGIGHTFKAGRAVERGVGRLDPIEFGSNETPHLDAMIDAIASRHNLSNPQVRHAFDQMLDQDPLGYLADLSLPYSLGTTAAAKTTGAAASLTRQIARIPRLPRSVKSKMGSAQALLDDAAGITKRTNQFMNESVYTIPDNAPWAAGIKIPGAATLFDIGAITFDTATDIMTQPFRRNRTNMIKQVADLNDPKAQEQLRALGIDPKEYAASAQAKSPGSIAVAGEESRRYKDYKIENPETVERLIDTAESLDTALQRFVDDIDASRPFDESMKGLLDAYNSFNEEYRGTRNGLYRAISEREGVTMSLTNTFEALQTIMDENREWMVSGTSPMPSQVGNFAKSIERFRSQAAPPQPKAAAAPGGGTAPPSGDSPSKPSANTGSPNRTVHSPANLDLEYPVTYEVVDASTLIPAHQSYNANAPRTPESEYPRAYQPKEMDDTGRALIEERARTLKPYAVIDFERSMDRGAPMVDAQNRIVGGNHRYWMMVRAREAYPDRWQNLLDYLKLMGPLEYNIDLAHIEGIEFPMLIQRIGADVDPIEMARESNAKATGGMSAGTKSQQNAFVLNDDIIGELTMLAVPDTLENILALKDNQDVLTAVLAKVDLNTLKEWETNGVINSDGYKAIANMFHARTFNTDAGRQMLSTFLEIDTPGMQNIRRGLFKGSSLHAFEQQIRAKQLEPEFSLADDLAQAITKFDELRKDGSTVADAIAQAPLPTMNTVAMGDISEASKMLLKLLAASTTEPSNLTNFITDYTIEAKRESAIANPLLMQEPGITKQALITKLVNRHAGDGKIDQAIDEMMASAKADPDDGGTGGKTETRIEDVVAEYQYINAERARTMFREMGDDDGATPTQKRWARIMERAIDADMIESIEEAYPDKAAQIRAVYEYVWQMSTIINSKIAKSMARNFDDVFIKETGETVADQGKQLIDALIKPNTSVGQVQNYKQLFGGESSPAWKSFQRLFMEKILEGAFTPEGKQSMVDRDRGRTPLPETATLRHRPSGINDMLAKYRNPFAEYKDAVLNEIIGAERMEALYAINEMMRRLTQLYRNVNGSQTPFLQKKNLANIFQEDRLSRYLMLAGGFAGGAAYATKQEILYLGGSFALAGAFNLVQKTYGSDAAARFLDNFNKFGDFSPEQVAEVFKQTWAQQTYRALRNAARQGVRFQRLQQPTQQWQHPFTKPFAPRVE